MKALIIGATGATGKELVAQLLANPAFGEVAVFVRRKTGLESPKLEEHFVDFDRPDDWKQLVTGDVAFSCLGTTLKAAGSKENQWKIDHDYQLDFARAARENGVPSYILVSAYGADPQSVMFYPKMKGRLEQAVRALDFGSATFFKPGMLDRANTERTAEIMGLKALKFLNKIGLLQKQKSLPTAVLAKAMIRAAKMGVSGTREICLGEIFSFAEERD